MRQTREGLSVVADVLGVIGGIAFLFGLAGNIPGFVAVLETWSHSGAVNVLLMVGGAVLVAIDLASRFGWLRSGQPLRIASLEPATRPRTATPLAPPKAEQAVTKLPKGGDRVLSHLSPADLLALVLTEGLTSAELKLLVAPHVGQWLPVDGTVNNVDRYPTFVQVVIDAGLKASIIVTFQSDLDRAGSLRKGVPIHIVGRIEGPTAAQYSFSLGDCEFL